MYGPLLRLRQSFPFIYLTDDGGPVYRAEAYREAVRLIEAEQISTIFSSFRPWSDHLVARRLKRKYPHLHWIADFRDLHADPVRKDVWWPALQRWWARRVIATADEVWGVSEGQVQYLKELHAKASVRRNRLFALPPPLTDPTTERFTIVYTGSLYDNLQTIAPLVSALNKLIDWNEVRADDIELIYRGKDDRLWAEWTSELNSKVHCNTRSYVEPSTAQQLQRDAQILLLLTWSAPGYYGVLTAKLYDYLSAGRPILGLVNGPQDPELYQIVEDSHAGKVFYDDTSPIDWLLGCYQQWKISKGRLPWSPNMKHMARYLEDEPVGNKNDLQVE